MSGELDEEEHAEFMVCLPEVTGTGAGVARQQDGLWRVWECLPVCPHLVQMDRNTAGVSCKSGDREVQAGLEVQKGRAEGTERQEPGLHGLRATAGDLLSIGKLTWDLAGLAVVPYLPCAPAGQAPVPNALA